MKSTREDPGSEVDVSGATVIIYEPAQCDVRVYDHNETTEVVLSFHSRVPDYDQPIGGKAEYTDKVVVDTCAQVIISLTANQALQLIERLQKRVNEYERAVASGRDGVRFPDKGDWEHPTHPAYLKKSKRA